MRCYLLCQLMLGYSFRQAGFWEYFCTQRQGWKPSSTTKQLPAPTDSRVATMLLKLVLFSLGTHSWIRKGIQGSLKYLSRNDHAHWIVFCLWRPQGSCWSKCWLCFSLPRVTFPFTAHLLPFEFFCQSPFKLKASSTPALSVWRYFNRYSQWQQKEVTLDCWSVSPSLSSPVHTSPPWYCHSKQHCVSPRLHCICRMTESSQRCPSTLKQSQVLIVPGQTWNLTLEWNFIL